MKKGKQHRRDCLGSGSPREHVTPGFHIVTSGLIAKKTISSSQGQDRCIFSMMIPITLVLVKVMMGIIIDQGDLWIQYLSYC
jgi:hypothetical protein